MYKYEQIRAVHLELTSKCNASCPMCLRNVCGGKVNPNLTLTELSLTDIKAIFSKEWLSQLKRIYMCGNYGDPVVAKETLEIFTYFRSLNDRIELSMFTNGSARSVDWWYNLSSVVDRVHFSIDGLSDTNHIYRRGTNFEKIIENMRSYISGGGKANWDYILFKHNEHQIEEARELAEKMGVNKFQVKKTGRFFSNTKLEGKSAQEVYSKNGDLEYYIEMPTQKQNRNTALAHEKDLSKKYGSIEKYMNVTKIDCKVAAEKSIYISAEGYVFPCCWTANQLYPWYYEKKSSYMWKLINKLPGGVNDLDAKKNTVENIVSGQFFTEILPHSWNISSIKEGRPKCCAKTCGKEFDPFKAQFVD